jgi:hypothetical protein
VGDSTGANTYTPLTSRNLSGDGTGQWFYAKNITGAADLVVTLYTTQGRAYIALQVFEISGVSATTPADVDAGGTFNGSTATTPTFSTAAAAEIILAGASFNNISITATAGGAYTMATQDALKVSAVEYLVVSETQTNVTADMSITSAGGSINAVSFKQ